MRHGLEAVTGDLDARRVVHDAGPEHQLVVRVGLDQDDVDARVALPPVLHVLVQPRVGQQLEGLVADLWITHVGDPAHPAAEDRRDPLLEVVHIGHQRVHHHDELRALLDRDIDVRRGPDAAVDELAAAASRRACRPSGGRWRPTRPSRSERRPIRAPPNTMRSQVSRSVRGQVQLGLEQPEVVRAVALVEELADVVLDPAPV